MLLRLLSDIFKKGPKAITNAASETSRIHTGNVIQLDNVNCLVQGRHGWFLANRFDVYLGGGLIQYGEYNEHEQVFLASLLHPDDIAIEVGANIGSHTIGLSKAVGPAGKVLAIEAQPTIFRVLCANVALNGINNISVYCLGCGARNGTMNVEAIDYGAGVPHNSGGVALTNTGTGIQVQVIPLDELADGLSRLRLIKIDVEGMEMEVLTGGANLIKKFRPLLYVENDRIEKSQALIEWIMAAGYRLWWHIPPLYNSDNYFNYNLNSYGNTASFNMFCQPIDAVDLKLIEGLTEITDPLLHPLQPQQ